MMEFMKSSSTKIMNVFTLKVGKWLKKMDKKHLIVIVLSLIISVISGIISNDLIIGGTILLTGFLCAYFASEGKRINYILGLINYLLMGYVAFKNNLFGIFLFTYLFFHHFKLADILLE